jgi:hypothetical protein
MRLGFGWGVFCHNSVMGTRQPRPVTFWCEHGSHEVTEERMPGPTPRYCRACVEDAQKALNRLRVKAHRERTAGPRTGWERPPGRPKRQG